MKKKYRKYKILIISIMLSSILYACNKSSEDINSTINSSKQGNSFIGSTTDDSQSYWCALGHNFAKGADGYYLLSDLADYILYFDSKTRNCIPLCGKADCKHNDNTCNAFLDKGTHLGDSIYYYNGFLYLLRYSDGNAILERVNPDGSGRQDICVIGPNERVTSIRLVFHGDSVYVFDGGHFSSNTEYTEKINRISLDGKSRETIFEYTGTNAKISVGKSYGDKLYFIIETLAMDDNRAFNLNGLGLFYYDYTTKESGKVIEEGISDFSIDENNNIIYYYVDCDGLYKMDLNTKVKSKIFNADNESGTIQLSFDGKYLFLSNFRWSQLNSIKKIPQKLWVIDVNGQLINTIPCDGIIEQFFGDENFLFARKIRSTAEGQMVYIDKSDIVNVKEWTWLNNLK